MRDDGRVKLCRLEDVQRPGEMPVQKLVVADEPFCSLVTAGFSRIYEAEGANKHFDVVLRCWNMTEVPTGVEYAVRENGQQYRIVGERGMYDSDSLEVSLARVEELYEVAGIS